MKKITLALLLAAVATTNFQCKPPEPAPGAATFTFEVEEDKDFSNLPALQSFVCGVADDGQWLLFGGRTNGFHGFADNQTFPFKLARLTALPVISG
jgi:hypothetical protein